MDDRHRDVALFRYSLIREAADPALTKAERGQMVRALAAREHTGPGGERVRVSRNTLDRWIRNWRAGGFDALVPTARTAEPTTPVAVLDLAVKLKHEAPARTAAQVAEVISAAQGWAPSERTTQRLFARLGLNTRPGGTPPEAFGRFEAAAANDRWTGDALHGRAAPSRQLGGVLRGMGIHLVPSREAEEGVRPFGGTKHTSALRYSYDDPAAVVIAGSDDGPVTVMREGMVVGRSPDDDASHA